MELSRFIHLLLMELQENKGLHSYYKPADRTRSYLFRRAYIEQRLMYIRDHIPESPCSIWDAGCGFGTAGIFLALNGYKVYGNTLEYYYDLIQRRTEYWKQFGDLSNLTIRYENLYDMPDNPEAYDVILLQDTLHHLEPVNEAAGIFYRNLKPGGRLLVVEENGSSIFIILKNFLKRGFRTTVRYYDERLGKTILMGNENSRGIREWQELFQGVGFSRGNDEVDYIRLFPPFMFNTRHYAKRLRQEREIIRKNMSIMRFICFGINFVLTKQLE
ncbi:MAG: methyltransferase domain-containing protein [Bacteroidales bacterium]|nr:methyltransferase domain-containing protein [Bacteroidales bacterium]